MWFPCHLLHPAFQLCLHLPTANSPDLIQLPFNQKLWIPGFLLPWNSKPATVLRINISTLSSILQSLWNVATSLHTSLGSWFFCSNSSPSLGLPASFYVPHAAWVRAQRQFRIQSFSHAFKFLAGCSVGSVCQLPLPTTWLAYLFVNPRALYIFLHLT